MYKQIDLPTYPSLLQSSPTSFPFPAAQTYTDPSLFLPFPTPFSRALSVTYTNSNVGTI